MSSFAEKEVLKAEKIWSGHPPRKSWVQGDPRSHFKKLDFDWYDTTAQAFEALGFRYAADTVDVNALEEMPYVHAFTREMLSADGKTIAFFYHFTLLGWRKLIWPLLGVKNNRRIKYLKTELTDGVYVSTSTAEARDSYCPPPWSDRDSMPLHTTPAELHARHNERVRQLCAAAPNRQPVVHKNYGDMHASEVRYHVRHCQHVHTPGVLAQQIYRIAKPGQEGAADSLAEGITVVQMERGFRPLSLEEALKKYPPPSPPEGN